MWFNPYIDMQLAEHRMLELRRQAERDRLERDARGLPRKARPRRWIVR
jgi:hypothetical protein